MLQIQNTLVSLDVVEKFFCCDLDACKGQCCVEGDAGAPVTAEEDMRIKNALPSFVEYMSSKGREEVEASGTSYIDEEGDLVTTIVDGKDCAFTCYNEHGVCLCAIEKAHRLGKIGNLKPISCSLYPIRLTQYPSFIAVNYHKWSVCEPALECGKKNGIRLYEFLKEPLIRRFGKEWWNELAFTAEIYLKEKEKK